MQCKERLHSTRRPRGMSPVTSRMWRSDGRGRACARGGAAVGVVARIGGSGYPWRARRIGGSGRLPGEPAAPAASRRSPVHAAEPPSTPNSPLSETSPQSSRSPKKSPGVFVVENLAGNALQNVGRYTCRPAVSYLQRGCGKQCAYTINGFLWAIKHNI